PVFTNHADVARIGDDIERHLSEHPDAPPVLFIAGHGITGWGADLAQARDRHIDVAAVQPDRNDPDWRANAAAARSKFLAEHRHAEDEVRFFVAGRACFYLHLEPEVFAVGCESG